MNRPITPQISKAIYFAKGFAVVLVVIGHNSLFPGIPHYWYDLRKIIFSFHMPLFMFLSGYLAMPNIYSASISFDAYKINAKKKFFRLMLPYITISCVMLILKLVSQQFFTIPLPISLDSLNSFFLRPLGGFNSLLWFIYSLYLINLIAPVFVRITNNSLLLLLFSFALSYLPWPAILSFKITFTMFPFFMLGLVFYKHDILNYINLNIVFQISLTLLMIIVGYYYLTNLEVFFDRDYLSFSSLKQVFATICVVFVPFISFLLSTKCSDNTGLILFASIGKYSASIYLFHTIFMGPFKILFYQVFNKGIDVYLFTSTTIIVSGVIFPIIFEKYFISRNITASKLLLGVNKKYSGTSTAP